jgi:hypothetical protein
MSSVGSCGHASPASPALRRVGCLVEKIESGCFMPHDGRPFHTLKGGVSVLAWALANSTKKPPEGGRLIEYDARQARAAGDTELMFLCGPAVRERAGKHGDGEIGWCAAVGNGFDDERRHEGQRSEVSDVALDLVLASGDLLERVDP